MFVTFPYVEKPLDGVFHTGVGLHESEWGLCICFVYKYPLKVNTHSICFPSLIEAHNFNWSRVNGSGQAWSLQVSCMGHIQYCALWVPGYYKLVVLWQGRVSLALFKLNQQNWTKGLINQVVQHITSHKKRHLYSSGWCLSNKGVWQVQAGWGPNLFCLTHCSGFMLLAAQSVDCSNNLRLFSAASVYITATDARLYFCVCVCMCVWRRGIENFRVLGKLNN